MTAPAAPEILQPEGAPASPPVRATSLLRLALRLWRTRVGWAPTTSARTC